MSVLVSLEDSCRLVASFIIDVIGLDLRKIMMIESHRKIVFESDSLYKIILVLLFAQVTEEVFNHVYHIAIGMALFIVCIFFPIDLIRIYRLFIK